MPPFVRATRVRLPAAERHIKAAGSRAGLAVRRGALLCALALLPAAACARAPRASGC
jgi:hypothetical protein